jgi:hypothetical protein
MVPESTLGHILGKVSERIRWMWESSGGSSMERREIPEDKEEEMFEPESWIKFCA